MHHCCILIPERGDLERKEFCTPELPRRRSDILCRILCSLRGGDLERLTFCAHRTLSSREIVLMHLCRILCSQSGGDLERFLSRACRAPRFLMHLYRILWSQRGGDRERLAFCAR